MLLGYLILFINRENILTSKTIPPYEYKSCTLGKNSRLIFTYQHSILCLYLLEPFEVNGDIVHWEKKCEWKHRKSRYSDWWIFIVFFANSSNAYSHKLICSFQTSIIWEPSYCFLLYLSTRGYILYLILLFKSSQFKEATLFVNYSICEISALIW